MSERIYGVATKAWQIVAGCDERMPCAEKCWAKGTVNRLAHSPNEKTGRFHRGLVREFHDCDDPQCGRKEHNVTRWTGTVKLNEAHLTDPLRWRKPAVIATGYHGDIFRLPPEQIDRVFAVMALCPQHTFLALTKLPERIVEYFARLHKMADDWAPHAKDGKFTPSDVLNLRWMHGTFGRGPAFPYGPWPLPNLYLGFSSSNQSEFDARWPHVAKLAAQGWKVWTSLEPLIGPMDMTCVRVGGTDSLYRANALTGDGFNGARLSQVVLGGESGKDARPMRPAWVRSVRDQCEAAGVPFHFKQWGDWAPYHEAGISQGWSCTSPLGSRLRGCLINSDIQGEFETRFMDPEMVGFVRVGKKLAGRTLDGRTHDELAWEVGR